MRKQVNNYELEKYCTKLRPLIEKIVSNLKYELLDLLFVSENQTNYLRLTISSKDKEHLISLDDCELISKEVGKELDLKNLIPFSYLLEVQSPGISGDLKNPSHEFVIKDVGLIVKS